MTKPYDLQGRELDLAIHREVFGNEGRVVDRVKINEEWREEKTWLPSGYPMRDPPAGHYAGLMPSYTRFDLMKKVWPIVERMIKKGFDPSIDYDSDIDKWTVTFWDSPHDGISYQHEKKSMAIGRAALQAVRVFNKGG